MDLRAKSIIKVLAVCLLASLFAAIVKIYYGVSTNTLAFIADGIHSVFDSSSTILGMLTIIMAAKPPDEGHPYGHYKFETLAAVVLATFLLFAAFELGSLARTRFFQPEQLPAFSIWGVLIMVTTLSLNIVIARWEALQAKRLASPFLKADSFHNLSDIGTDVAVLVSLGAAHLGLPYVDAVVCALISVYLVFLSMKLILQNISPLVDKRVLDKEEVARIANSVQGVLDCHNIRSRGQIDHHFLDLNIHLPGNITLEEAHNITHAVEGKLKETFPGLVDVVIHTEPHGHPPCCADDRFRMNKKK